MEKSVLAGESATLPQTRYKPSMGLDGAHPCAPTV